MIGRFAEWLWLVLAGLSRFFANTVIAGLWWAITGRGSLPNPCETFSSRVGRAAVAGKRWGLAAEWIIDHLLRPGHCRDSIERPR